MFVELLALLLVLLCLPLQDPVWAEQAHVFPDWHTYSASLSKRARLADRHWLDSISLKSSSTASSAKANGGVADHVQAQAGPGSADEVAVRSDDGVGLLGRASVWLKRVATGLNVE
jgi:hypothetical protein